MPSRASFDRTETIRIRVESPDCQKRKPGQRGRCWCPHGKTRCQCLATRDGLCPCCWDGLYNERLAGKAAPDVARKARLAIALAKKKSAPRTRGAR